MTDYTQNVSYGPKDALSSGDANKLIRGSEIDAELSEIATAIASKEDEANKGAANGYCGLDASGLVASADLPAATDAAQGAVELATDAEAVTGTDATRAVTPASLEAWAAQNGGIVKDLSDIADPGADVVLGWDESANAAIGFTLGTGLTSSGTAITTNDSQIVHDSLSGFVANEHIDHSAVSITAGSGLTGGGTLEATRTINVGAGAGIAVAADAVSLDLNTIASGIAGNAVVSTDTFPVNDGGTTKYITAANSGLPVDTVTGAKTLTSADANRVQYSTSAGAYTLTLNTGVGVVGNVIPIFQSGAGQITVGGTATVVSANGLKTRTQYSVAVLLCVAANAWVMYGDTST